MGHFCKITFKLWERLQFASLHPLRVFAGYVALNLRLKKKLNYLLAGRPNCGSIQRPNYQSPKASPQGIQPVGSRGRGSSPGAAAPSLLIGRRRGPPARPRARPPLGGTPPSEAAGGYEAPGGLPPSCHGPRHGRSAGGSSSESSRPRQRSSRPRGSEGDSEENAIEEG